MTRELIITHGDKEYTGHIATVTRTFLGVEDHGFFTALLTCEWDGAGQTFGGQVLDDKPKPGAKGRTPSAYGMDFLLQVIRTVGVSSWEDIVNTKIVVLHSRLDPYGYMKGIAHLTDENRVFFPDEHFESWKDRLD